MNEIFEPEDAAPIFPPLLIGESVPKGVDPLAKAVAASVAGIDAGVIFWSERRDRLDAALVLAPETVLAEAMTMVMAVANGLGDSLGALTPPEVAVTWDWPDGVRVNGARCGVLRARAASRDPAAIPDWLVIGATLQLAPGGDEPGRDPTITALAEEGGADITRTRLLESWSRHMLVWINRGVEDGFHPLHDAYVGRVDGRGERVRVDAGGATHEGLFLGLDDQGGMLLKSGETTQLLPLTCMLGHARAWPPASDAPSDASSGDPI